MKLTANMEDYLEAISFCAGKDGAARISTVGEFLGVKTPSVTGAMKALAKEGYVLHERYRGVTLTAKGRRAAEEVKKRHAILKRFLETVLGVNPKTAEQDACKMEHAVSRETMEKLHAHLHQLAGDTK
jgi:DtxR family Mn-dependent transcriptional regulator